MTTHEIETISKALEKCKKDIETRFALFEEGIKDQFIEDNIEILETYFMENDDMGMQCNKDNIEDYFSSWLENHEQDELIQIIKNESNETNSLDTIMGNPLEQLEKLTIIK